MQASHQVLNQTNMATIRVRHIQTGQTGTMDDSEFDPNTFEQISADEPSQGAGAGSIDITPEMVKNAFLTDPKVGEILQKAFNVQEKAKETDKPSPGQEKINTAATAIDQLEEIYLGTGSELPLSFAKEQVGGRLPGSLKGFQKALAPGTFPESTRLNTYERTLESIRPMLAKAAGDAGNLALQEQISAGKGLPDKNSTPEEAVALFKAMRKKFSLPESEKLTVFEKERLPQLKQQNKGKGAADKLLNFLFGDTLSFAQDIKASIEQGKVAEESQASYGEGLRLLSMADKETDKEAKRELLVEANNIFKQISGRESAVQSKFSEDVGRGAASRGLGVGLEVGGALDLGLGAKGLVSGAKLLKGGAGKVGGAIAKPFKSKAPAVTEKTLEEGLRLAQRGEGIRSKALADASRLGKRVDGSAIFKNIEKWAVKAKAANPASKNKIDAFVKGIRPVLKGKKIKPETARSLWDTAQSGFTSAGKAGKTITQGYNLALRDGIRSAAEKVAPGFDKGTKLIRQGLEKEKILKPVRTGAVKSELRQGMKTIPSPLTSFLQKSGSRIASGAASGAGLFAIAKLLGVKVPGAFSNE